MRKFEKKNLKSFRFWKQKVSAPILIPKLDLGFGRTLSRDALGQKEQMLNPQTASFLYVKTGFKVKRGQKKG